MKKNKKKPIKKNKAFYVNRLILKGDSRKEKTLENFSLAQLKVMDPKLDDFNKKRGQFLEKEEILDMLYKYLDQSFYKKSDGIIKMELVSLTGFNKFVGLGYAYVQNHPNYSDIKHEVECLLEERILSATARGDIPNQFSSFFLKNRYEYSDNKYRDEIYKEELKLKQKANEIISNRENEVDLSDEELLAIISKEV